MGKVSRAARLYIAAVVVAAVVLIALTPPGDREARWWIELGVLQLLFLICDSTPTPLASRQSAWSPSSSATLAAVVLLGPAGAALVGAISVLSLRRHLIATERLFNGAMYAVSGYAAGRAYLALDGIVGTPLPHDFPLIICAPSRRAGQAGGAAGTGCAGPDCGRCHRCRAAAWPRRPRLPPRPAAS